MVICHRDKRKLMQEIMSFHHHRYSSRAELFCSGALRITERTGLELSIKSFSTWTELSFFIFGIFSHNLNNNLLIISQIHISSSNFSQFLAPHILFADILIWTCWNTFKTNNASGMKNKGIESLEYGQINVVFPWKRNNKAKLPSMNEQNSAKSAMKNSDDKVSSALVQQTTQRLLNLKENKVKMFSLKLYFLKIFFKYLFFTRKNRLNTIWTWYACLQPSLSGLSPVKW